MNTLEISFKQICGEELTDDERSFIAKRNAKYELVRFLIMEQNPDLEDFHFSPGEKFVDTPTLDVVKSILSMNEKIKSGDYEVLDFGDLKWNHNPPQTGIAKRDLADN